MREYFKLVPAVYVILRKDDEILLLKRANTGYFDGFYSVPAGHVDGGEPAIEAAVREVKEEVGVTIKPENLKLAHTVHWVSPVPYKHERIGLFFESANWTGKLMNNEPEKCSEIKWVNIAKLPDKLVPEAKSALENYFKDIGYSDFNF